MQEIDTAPVKGSSHDKWQLKSPARPQQRHILPILLSAAIGHIPQPICSHRNSLRRLEAAIAPAPLR